MATVRDCGGAIVLKEIARKNGPSLARGREVASPSLDATQVPWPVLSHP